MFGTLTLQETLLMKEILPFKTKKTHLSGSLLC